MGPLIPTAAVLVLNEGKILVVKHTKNAKHLTDSYGLPGGRVDPGENELQAAKRELFEESGLVAEEKDLHDFPNNIFYAQIQQKDGLKNFSWKVFLCQKFTGQLTNNEEGIPEWVTPEQFNTLNLLSNCKDAYANALKFLQNQ